MSRIEEIVGDRSWFVWLRSCPMALLLLGALSLNAAGQGNEDPEPWDLPEEVAEHITFGQAEELVSRLNEAVRTRDPEPIMRYTWKRGWVAVGEKEGRQHFPLGTIVCRSSKGPLQKGLITVDSEEEWRSLWAYDVSHASVYEGKIFTLKDLKVQWNSYDLKYRISVDNVIQFILWGAESESFEGSGISYSYVMKSQCEELQEAGFERAPEIEEWKEFAYGITESHCGKDSYGKAGCGFKKDSVEKSVKLMRDALNNGLWKEKPFEWNIRCYEEGINQYKKNSFRTDIGKLNRIIVNHTSIDPVWTLIIEEDRLFLSLKTHLPTAEDVWLHDSGPWGGYIQFLGPKSAIPGTGWYTTAGSWYAAAPVGEPITDLQTGLPCERIRAEILERRPGGGRK